MPYYVIGLGCKARNGKDTVASIWKDLEENVYIVHFADSLYEEVKNIERQIPLISKIYKNGIYWYLLNDNGNIKKYSQYEVPKLHKIFSDRKIEEYWGMNEKDPEILQFWGTDFRREKCLADYWIIQTEKKIKNIIKQITTSPSKNSTENHFFLIPDTRFKNELNFIKDRMLGLFIKIERYELNGKQYIDPTRDSKHSSETELDEIQPDYLIKANSGDLETLKRETQKVINIIKNGEIRK